MAHSGEDGVRSPSRSIAVIGSAVSRGRAIVRSSIDRSKRTPCLGAWLFAAAVFAGSPMAPADSQLASGGHLRP